jgi:hypothetical protein
MRSTSIRSRVDPRLAALVVLSAAFVVTCPAFAQEPTPAPSPAPTTTPTPAAPPKNDYLERFQAGIEKYGDGAYAEAIGYWDAIYRELGPQKGYRLAFNMARAYEKLRDFTQAAERYELFLAEYGSRKLAGVALDTNVDREASEAKDRLAELQRTTGRIRVNAGTSSLDAKIDATPRRAAGFTAYVAPGDHTVTFVRGNTTVDARSVHVKAGELVEATPPADPTPQPQPAPRIGHRLERPFSPVVLYIGAGATVLSVLVPLLTYNNALNIAHSHDGSIDPAFRAKAEADYPAARTTAYATLAVPLTLGVATGALATWFFLGSSERAFLIPAPMPTPDGRGAALAASARF